MQNVMADTQMRDGIAKAAEPPASQDADSPGRK